MIKDSRLSFRISDKLNDDIEKMVIIKRDVRDRSDLGNQSVEFYLDLLENKKLDEQIFMKAIIKIADDTGHGDLEEVKVLKEKLDWFNKITIDPLNVEKHIK